MQAEPRPSLDPAGAGGLLITGIGVGTGIGALIGWAAGSIGIGALVGAILGIPAGVFAVYRRYRGFFS
jgi:F0F1-type ATP synthase assembly protein I